MGIGMKWKGGILVQWLVGTVLCRYKWIRFIIADSTGEGKAQPASELILSPEQTHTMFSHAKVTKTSNAAMSTKKLHNKIIIRSQLLMEVFEVVNNSLIIFVIINY